MKIHKSQFSMYLKYNKYLLLAVKHPGGVFLPDSEKEFTLLAFICHNLNCQDHLHIFAGVISSSLMVWWLETFLLLRLWGHTYCYNPGVFLFLPDQSSSWYSQVLNDAYGRWQPSTSICVNSSVLPLESERRSEEIRAEGTAFTLFHEGDTHVSDALEHSDRLGQPSSLL